MHSIKRVTVAQFLWVNRIFDDRCETERGALLEQSQNAKGTAKGHSILDSARIIPEETDSIIDQVRLVYPVKDTKRVDLVRGELTDEYVRWL